jgi:cytochrome c553
MNRTLKKLLLGVGAIVGVAIGSAGAYVFVQGRAFDESINKVYDVPLTSVARSTDPAVIARGKHVAEALMPCGSCHGEDFGGGKGKDAGPVMFVSAPNITTAGMGAAYNDAELFRLLRHGVKKDGRSVKLMPVPDWNWLPDADLVAVISYLRTLPAVERTNGPMRIKWLGKVLDRRDSIPIDVARRIDHTRIEIGPAEAAPTAEYGKWLARMCSGCHGATFAGGPLPGAPPSIPKPLNLTPHETGLKGFTYDDFVQLFATGLRKDGRKLDSFMPREGVNHMTETEKRALFAFLTTLPPKPFGAR